MLLVNNLKFERSGKVIFENIHIAASSGKIVFVKGNNGTGKTTLLKTLVNILEPIGNTYFKFTSVIFFHRHRITWFNIQFIPNP